MIQKLYSSIKNNSNRKAFCIAGSYYTYKQFLEEISLHRSALKGVVSKLIGVVANDDIQTYAAIIAIWFEGKGFVPINPVFPHNYNESVVTESEIRLFFDSSKSLQFRKATAIPVNAKSSDGVDLPPPAFPGKQMAYLFFTSGSTGEPKGVPVTHRMLECFIESNRPAGIVLRSDDRCLQIFDLSFDLSLGSFIPPLMEGACVYTIPNREIKYAYIYKLLTEDQITCALMVPSVLPFLNKIVEAGDCNSLRYSLFCGEALELTTALEWADLASNTEIFNLYGPTEATVYCTYHKLERSGEKSSKNGIVSIGIPLIHMHLILLDEDGNEVRRGEIGEICLGGEQTTDHYWRNRNPEQFFTKNGVSFYRTGDLGLSENGLFYFMGRKDSQVQVQGYRVELLDVEYRIKNILKGLNAMAYSFPLAVGGVGLGIVIESKQFDTRALVDSLKLELPGYMMPTVIEFLEIFPLNSNGKLDRGKVRSQVIPGGDHL